EQTLAGNRSAEHSCKLREEPPGIQAARTPERSEIAIARRGDDGGRPPALRASRNLQLVTATPEKTTQVPPVRDSASSEEAEQPIFFAKTRSARKDGHESLNQASTVGARAA